MAQGLSVNRNVSIAVNLAPPAPQAQSINSCLILGSSDVIDTVQRMRTYASSTAVATDFGTTAPEYMGAVEWFDQLPQPTSLLIGRWAETATAGRCVGATLTSAQQAIAVWTAVTAGSFTVTLNGGAATNVTALNFSAVTNLNGVASVIQTALPAGTTCTWNATYGYFMIKSSTTGATSSVSFLSPEGTGTDISGMLGMTSASSGAYLVQGMAAESALAAAQLFDANFGSQWYGYAIPQAADADHTAIATWNESATTRHYYGVTTQEAGVLSSTSTTDVAYELSQISGLNHTCVQYSSTSAYAVISYLARILTTNWSANNSTITLKFKQEPGNVAENLNATQAGALEAKNCNVFVNYNDATAIIEQGVSCSGQFTDTIVGLDWLATQMQNDLYTQLYQSATKIPMTDSGNHVLATTIANTLERARNNGLIAPGQWNTGGFGSLSEGDYLKTGYYIYQPPVASMTAADRSARKSVPFQVAINLAGAIHSVSVTVNVNT